MPPSVTIKGNLFTLNNRALMDLSNVWGGMGFAIQLFVSECGDFVGFAPKSSDKTLTGQPKTVSSVEAIERLGVSRVDTPRIELKLENNILVGKVRD